MNDIRATLLLSLQRALLNAVPLNLRAVSCDWEGTDIKLRFVFDGEVSDANFDEVQIVGAEVIADFPAPWTISEDVVRLDYPADTRPGSLAHWAYMRKEDAKWERPIEQ
ncbi:hypothetical protein [Mesorhizobium sp. Mes31]|uniref:hypothetical protein n=1 Tax=Mesorhizobium sp. Mes31 TaxID=2926017 RepID=UPI002118502E|nr:hypothetical protein [Mesorhizobium sp. Mes31]